MIIGRFNFASNFIEASKSVKGEQRCASLAFCIYEAAREC